MGRAIDLTAEQISQRLIHAQGPGSDPPYPEFPYLAEILTEEPKPAAVLIPLLRFTDEWHVLFTRRNAGLPEHSGQVAFPGGRADPGDPDPETTALRETWEETGISPVDVQVMGRLPRFLTITNYLVTPVVGQIPWPYPLQPAQAEVSRIFTIPLNWLADPANYQERSRALAQPFSTISVIYFNEYDGEVLWGASARFMLVLIKILNQDTSNLA